MFGMQQNILFPSVYFAQKKLNKANYNLESTSYAIKEKALKRQVTSNYYQYLHAVEKEQIYKKLDSLYQNFSNLAQRRFELGETNYLEKITAKSIQRQVNINLLKATEDVSIAFNKLMSMLQLEDRVAVVKISHLKASLEILSLNESPEIAYYSNSIIRLQSKRSLQKQKLLPDISLEYFQGSNSGINTNLYGYQLGLKIPILFVGKSSKIKASKIAEHIAIEEFQNYEIKLKTKYDALLSQLNKHQKALDYYEEEGADLSDEILKTANGSFKNGEIDFYQYILSLENAYDIQLDHLENLNTYNQTVIAINYLTF